MKCLSSGIFGLILVIFSIANGSVVEDNLNNEDILNNDLMYLYKQNGQSENYLNYRAVYGLRYIPTKKTVKAHLGTENNEKSVFNVTIPNEIIHVSETDDTQNAIEEDYTSSAANSYESETSSVTSTESFEGLPYLNFSDSVIDESRNHIMRPNNRVEFALSFLSERLKQLLYHSMDESRPESKLSPHLTTLGRFLNLFNLIRFENIPCMTAHKPLRQLSGTCYSEIECSNLGGIAVDQCASGFGVCCVCKFRLLIIALPPKNT